MKMIKTDSLRPWIKKNVVNKTCYIILKQNIQFLFKYTIIVFFFVLEIIINCFQRGFAFVLCPRPGLCACNYIMDIFPKALVGTDQTTLTSSNKFSCSIGINIGPTMKQLIHCPLLS